MKNPDGNRSFITEFWQVSLKRIQKKKKTIEKCECSFLILQTMKTILITFWFCPILIINSCSSNTRISTKISPAPPDHSTKKELTISGQITTSNVTGFWNGVNIPRAVPTKFTYQNNSITSVNSSGYLLQAGDEGSLPSNNNLDNELITGNKFIWNGIPDQAIITHGIFVGYNINSIVRYNYLQNVPYGIIFKSGTDAGVNMTFTSGGCAYNICRNGKFAGRVKGINGVKFYNNTFYSGDGKGWYLLLVTGNSDRAIPSPSVGTKIFNNIFYSTTQIPMIEIESGCLKDFESDYNVYWCSAGEPLFNIDGVNLTWAQWRARGYDTHSKIIDPDFKDTVHLVPATRLDYGKNLGADWQTGLSVSATWTTALPPATADQNGTWQAGAYVYAVTGK